MDVTWKLTPAELALRLQTRWSTDHDGPGVIEVGLSGGLDSVCLLWLLHAAGSALPARLQAVHVHHGLSPEADNWQLFCERLCRDWGIPLRMVRVDVLRRGGESLEAVARTQRYQAYQTGNAAVIALAHHADDQAETVLLQTLRGAGPRGLAAMPQWRALGAQLLWRPLLGVTRAQLVALARANGLAHIEDESNQNPRFRRNFIRHHVLPLVRQYYPDYVAQLNRVAARAADAAAILQACADADLAAAWCEDGYDLDVLAALSEARQRNAWARILEQRCGEHAAPEALEAWRVQSLYASVDAIPRWRLGDYVLFRYRRLVHVVRWTQPPTESVVLNPCPGVFSFPNWSGQLMLTAGKGEGVRALAGEQWHLAPRRGGESLQIAGVGRRSVKKLLQEAGIAPYWRERWPLLYGGEQLLALPGIAVDATCRTHADELGWCVDWTPDGISK